MQLFFYMFTSVICAFGLAVTLVEKRFSWPVRNINLSLRWALRRLVHRKMARMPQCSVCVAFWAGLIADAAICVGTKGKYFMWPLSGFAASGLTWAFYEILKTLDGLKVEPVEPCAEYEEFKELMMGNMVSSERPCTARLDFKREFELMAEERGALYPAAETPSPDPANTNQ